MLDYGASAGGANSGLTKLHLAADASIPNNAWTAVIWDAVDIDQVGAYSASNKTRLTVPNGLAQGFLRITLYTTWDNNSTNSRFSRLDLNGSASTIQEFDLRISQNETGQNAQSNWIPVSFGNYYEILVLQNKGTAINLSGTSGANFGRPTYVQAEWQ